MWIEKGQWLVGFIGVSIKKVPIVCSIRTACFKAGVKK